MDRKKVLESLKERFKAGKKKFLFVGIAVFALVAGVLFAPKAKPLTAAAVKGWDHAVHVYGESFRNVQTKVEDIQALDEENSQLRLENANLRRWVETVRFDCSLAKAESRTRELGMKLNEETGARVGRILAGIDYRPPGHLLPDQLNTLALSYFRTGENEKSAVLFTFLTGLEENQTYKTPKHYLLTGVSWYRLDHYRAAEEYFDKVLALDAAPEVLQYHAQARLWKALTAEKTQKRTRAQHYLRELVDHHPRSMEAAWVNPHSAVGLGAGRMPASDVESSENSLKEENHELQPANP